MATIEEFTGQLDAPTVEEFTGKLDTPPPDQYPSITSDVSGFVETPLPGETPQNFMQKATMPYNREPFIEPAPAAPFVLGTAGAVMTGGGSIPLQMLAAGTGATAGKMIQQKAEHKPLDLADAVGEGGETALWTGAGGMVFKGLAGLASKMFSPVAPEVKEAAKFAQKEGLPFPASGQLSKTGSMHAVAQNMTLPARIITKNQATQAYQFLNRQMGQVTENAKVVDEVAQSGQRFFKNVFDTAKETGESGFSKFLDTLGRETPTPLTNTRPAIEQVLSKMRASGNDTGSLYQRLAKISKRGTNELPLEELDTVRKAINKGAKGANLMRSDKEALIDAIQSDYDTIGQQLGLSAKEMSKEAIAKYAKFNAIRKAYPYLERFGKGFGEKGGTYGSKQWFGELFTEKNAGALNYIRKESPQLYRELSDTYVAQILEQNTKAETGLFGKVIDGEKLVDYIGKNKNTMRSILGEDRVNVLSNFANYAKNIKDLLKTQPITGEEYAQRMAAGAYLAYTKPHIFLPNQAAAYVLSKGLSSPRSTLFRAFMKEAKWGKIGGPLGAMASRLDMREQKNKLPADIFSGVWGNF